MNRPMKQKCSFYGQRATSRLHFFDGEFAIFFCHTCLGKALQSLGYDLAKLFVSVVV